MSRWYGDEDPFTKVGCARVIVARINPTYSYRGELDNCTHIIGSQTFPYGFLLKEFNKSRWGEYDISPNWLKTEVEETCEHQINHIMSSLPKGIYELICDIYHWSSRSYEGEWDGDSEIRNHRVRRVNFDSVADLEICEDQLSGDVGFLHMKDEDDNKSLHFFNSDVVVHPYMEKRDILVRQLQYLNNIISNSNRLIFNDKETIQDLENMVYMFMMQIDSERTDKAKKEALHVDEVVKNCLQQHEKYMGDV